MKKFLCLLLIFCMTITFVGCSDDEEKNISAVDELEVSEQSEKEKTEETLENRDRNIDTDDMYVFDDSQILTNGEYDALNSQTAWISKTFKINAAVVITDDIGESSPADFSKKFYESKYSGDGILILINNDTNNDYFYRHGIVSKFISDIEVKMTLADISPMLALEDYVSAVGRMLETVEYFMPEFFTDRTGELESEEILSYNDYIKENTNSGTINVYYVKGIGEQPIEDFAKERFNMFYESNSDSAMLIIDGENGENYLCTSGNMNYLEESHSEIQLAVKSCYDKTKGMDLENAVKNFIEFVE